MWVAQDKIRYESVYLFICLLNKRAESSTTGAAYASVALDRSQEARPAGLDRAVEFVNSIETLADVFAMVSCQAILAVRTAFLTVWRSMSV